MDPNGHRQWARPSPRVFILKELNAAECEGLACETRWSHPSPILQGKCSPLLHALIQVASRPAPCDLASYLGSLKGLGTNDATRSLQWIRLQVCSGPPPQRPCPQSLGNGRHWNRVQISVHSPVQSPGFTLTPLDRNFSIYWGCGAIANKALYLHNEAHCRSETWTRVSSMVQLINHT